MSGFVTKPRSTWYGKAPTMAHSLKRGTWLYPCTCYYERCLAQSRQYQTPCIRKSPEPLQFRLSQTLGLACSSTRRFAQSIMVLSYVCSSGPPISKSLYPHAGQQLFCVLSVQYSNPQLLHVSAARCSPSGLVRCPIVSLVCESNTPQAKTTWVENHSNIA